MLFKEIGERQEKIRKIGFITVAVIIILAFTICEVIIYLKVTFGVKQIAYLEFAMTLFLSVSLIFVTVRLKRKLKKFEIRN